MPSDLNLVSCLYGIANLCTSFNRDGHWALIHGTRLILSQVMKNIALSATWRSVIPNVNITTVSVDVENACLWIGSERLNADADTEIDVYKRRILSESDEVQDVSILFAYFRSLPGHHQLGTFTANVDSIR